MPFPTIPTAETHPILQVLAQMLPPPGNLWGLLPKRNSPPLRLQRDCGMSLWSCEFNEGNAWPLLKKGTALLWPQHRVRARLCILQALSLQHPPGSMEQPVRLGPENRRVLANDTQ